MTPTKRNQLSALLADLVTGKWRTWSGASEMHEDTAESIVSLKRRLARGPQPGDRVGR